VTKDEEYDMDLYDDPISNWPEECKAYKPWISVRNKDGKLQATCKKCIKLGQCDWTLGVARDED
jgi:hypothetical protein